MVDIFYVQFFSTVQITYTSLFCEFLTRCLSLETISSIPGTPLFFLPVCVVFIAPVVASGNTALRVHRPCCVLRRRCRIVVARGNAVRTSSVERYKNRRSSKRRLRIEDSRGAGEGEGQRRADRRSFRTAAGELGRWSLLLFFLVDQVWIRPQVNSQISGIHLAGFCLTRIYKTDSSSY